ncbi:MAG: MBL fold metallo-hydrolase [Armatimonadota bacterium]
MTFTILGTAAAEGWPALWCACDACREARRLGGKNIRRRAAYQLGERIRIDLGPDSYAQMLAFDLHYERLEHLLITHSHADHLCPQELHFRAPGFVACELDTRLRIRGNAAVQERLLAAGFDPEGWRARFELIAPFEAIDLSEGVVATPLLADHAGSEQAVNYLLQRHGRTLLQGNDTGWWPDPTWEFLAGTVLDVLLIECTYGPREGGRHHLGAQQVLQVRDRLGKLGALAPHCRVITTHFSHNGGWLHERLEEFFAPHGIEVAYDGMTLEL